MSRRGKRKRKMMRRRRRRKRRRRRRRRRKSLTILLLLHFLPHTLTKTVIIPSLPTLSLLLLHQFAVDQFVVVECCTFHCKEELPQGASVRGNRRGTISCRPVVVHMCHLRSRRRRRRRRRKMEEGKDEEGGGGGGGEI